MKTYVLDSEQYLARGIGEVFAFFSDPVNLQRITPPWLDFRILTPAPLEMRQGVRIDYRLRLRGFPLRWQSEITAWEPPRRFVDEQRRGPYRVWIHEHTFLAQNGGTVIRDHVEYAIFGGAVVRTLFVARDLEKIFAFRRAQLERILR